MFDSHAYGETFASVIPADRVMSLDAGNPNELFRAALDKLSVTEAFEGKKVVDDSMARCCLAGVWLVNDYLDESHTISQSVGSASGSYWHGIMHRREGDFSNAKYWFHRVGDHPVFAELQTADGTAWDPYRFVDDCQRALRSKDSGQQVILSELQQREWQALFDFCYRAAIG